MAKHFGISYQGSKDRIALDIHKQLPSGKRFVDLFGGGFAMSHAALLIKGKYEKVYYNELNPLLCDFIKKACSGYYNYDNGFKPEWISREDFERLKDKDGYIRYIWSFGNNGKGYLFGKDVEPIKKQGHEYVIFGKQIEGLNLSVKGNERSRRMALRKYSEEHLKRMRKDKHLLGEYKKYKEIKESCKTNELAVEFTTWLRGTGITAAEINKLTNSQMASHYLCIDLEGQPAIPTVEIFEMLKKSDKIKDIPERILNIVDKRYQLQQLERLQQLEQLERLERLERLEINCGDYHNYKYQSGDIVYLDPPYENTYGYNQDDFDHKDFYDWCASRKYQVWFSSYKISDNRFRLVWAKRLRGLAAGSRSDVYNFECLYTNK